MKLLFSHFVYQIIVQGDKNVIVVADEDAAQKYAEVKLRNADVLILPVAVFTLEKQR